MALQPLPQAILTAHKLREQAKTLLLLADELEASAPKVSYKSDGKFLFGEVKQRRRKASNERENK